jgi:hypothetical protein
LSFRNSLISQTSLASLLGRRKGDDATALQWSRHCHPCWSSKR